MYIIYIYIYIYSIIKYTKKIKHIDKYSNQGEFCKTQAEVFLQSETKFMKQCQKSSIIGQEEKALTFVFTPFLITSVKVLFLEGKLGTRFFLHPVSIFIKYFLIF